MVELIQVRSLRQPFSSYDAFQGQDVRGLPQQGIILGVGIPYFPLLHPFSHHLYCVDSNSILFPRSLKRPSTLSSKRSRSKALGWLIGIFLLESSALRSFVDRWRILLWDKAFLPFLSLAKGAKFVKGTDLRAFDGGE